MTATLRDELDLDQHTINTLETSLAMQIIKLFAIMTKADTVVSDEERRFVEQYCSHLYPAKIAKYLFSRFEEYLSTTLDLDKVALTINNRLSYQEKIFCLLKTYELIVSDSTDESELRLILEISELLQIDPADIAFIEYIFNIRPGSSKVLSESAILQLIISGDLSNCDVYIPYEELNLEIYKIYDLYCFVQKGTSNLLMDNHRVMRGVFTRIQHNADLMINDYVMKYQDLKIYFENKVHPILTELFLSLNSDKFSWEKEKSEKSLIHLKLEGSHITLTPLSDQIKCQVNDQVISSQQEKYINLSDTIVVNNNHLNIREISFHLNREKTMNLPRGARNLDISNDPRADIFIACDLPSKWKANIARKNDEYHLNRGDCPYQIRINGKTLTGDAVIGPSDTIFINNRFLNFDFEKSTVKQTLFSFEKLVANALQFAFDDGTRGLDNVSFEIGFGDLVSIMGPSGCGKSTLLTLISGFSRPEDGKILLGEHDLHKEFTLIKDYLGYVPQDDLLFSNLTVYENLYYNAKLRFPDRSKEELDAQIDLVLHDIGLFEKKHTKVGSPLDKKLSGGQRKRLNIGLELLANAEVYLLDEPTSGLSSKDSENIVELLSNIASRGKIVLAVIHQPSSKLYKLFNKIILLDKGGHLVYFGTTYSALSYFQAHRDNGDSDSTLTVECPSCKSVQPDLLLDTLEESLRDVDGTRLAERKYSPEYWKDQFDDYLKEQERIEAALPKLEDMPPSQILSFSDRFNQFRTLLSRTFRCKLRDRTNLIITFLGAPVLGILVGLVTKFAPNDNYNLMDNDLFNTFLFTAVIVAMFFGMTNSVDEIIVDRAILLRERMLSLQNRSYLAAKLIVLFGFAILQNVLFLGIGLWSLEVRELYFYHIGYLSLVSLAGISLGLFISSVPNISSKAAQNFIPLLLIPQIILGGSLVSFDKMNRELRFYKESPIPEICQLMPSRWAYEGIVVLQATYNSFDDRYNEMGDEMNALKRDRQALYKDRDNIIAQHGEAHFKAQTDQFTKKIDQIKFERESFLETVGKAYGNSDIHQKVALADATFGQSETNVYDMLVSRKHLPVFTIQVNTALYNAVVVFFLAVFLIAATLLMLRYNERVQKSVIAIRIFWHSTRYRFEQMFKKRNNHINADA